MKIWVLISLFGFLFSLPVKAQIPDQTEEAILLSYEEFSQLTPTEQKTYVKKMREIMVEVAQAFPEMAQQGLSARSNLVAQLWNLNLPLALGDAKVPGHDVETIVSYVKYANAEAKKYAKAIADAKTSDLSEQDKNKLVEQYRQALYWSSSAATQAYSIPDKTVREKLLQEVTNPTKKVIEEVENKIKKVASEAEYSFARDGYFKKAHRGEILPGTVNFPAGAWVPFGERLKTDPVPPIKAAKDELPLPLPEPPKEKQSDTPPPVTPPNTPNDSYYRCMYSGFVVKKHPCLAPSRLPWELKYIDDEIFKCENRKVMCNPLLFGFKTNCEMANVTDQKQVEKCYASAKPFCVRPGLYATKNCGEISNSDQSLQAAVHLIHNNAAVFNQYGQSFNDLCNKGLINFNSYQGHQTPRKSARTKADIKRTCDRARVRMDEIKKRYQIYVGQNKKTNSPATSKPPAQETKGKQ